jgi:hypothetical protein
VQQRGTWGHQKKRKKKKVDFQLEKYVFALYSVPFQAQAWTINGSHKHKLVRWVGGPYRIPTHV